MGTNGGVEFQLWSKSAWSATEVAGEVHHRAQIRVLFPAKIGDDQREIVGLAQLQPEPTNRHDRNAIKVVMRGAHVGYLPRDLAGKYAPVLTELVSQGLQPVTKCRVYGYEYDDWKGEDRRGNTVYERVFRVDAWVTLDAPHLIVPSNLPPSGRHRELPFGKALQLKGEEDHMGVLAPLVEHHGETAVIATLHHLDITSGRSSKPVVEVRVDGQAIGTLTPAMSAHYLPVVAHLADEGSLTSARVYLKGNQLKVEAALHAARSHELDASWFGDSARSTYAAPSAALDQAPTTGSVTVGALQPPFSLPNKPTKILFRVPPGWAQPPDGWEPPTGWSPPAEWPAPPANWAFWVAE